MVMQLLYGHIHELRKYMQWLIELYDAYFICLICVCVCDAKNYTIE